MVQSVFRAGKHRSVIRITLPLPSRLSSNLCVKHINILGATIMNKIDPSDSYEKYVKAVQLTLLGDNLSALHEEERVDP